MPVYRVRPRLPLSIAVLVLAVWPFSDMEGPAQGQAQAHGQGQPPHHHGPASSPLEGFVDPAVAPGDDFFAYANGAWLKAATIPAGRHRWTVRDDISARTRRQVTAILDAAGTAGPGSLGRTVADFRAAFLNQTAIDRTGLAALAPLLARIDQIGDPLALTRFLASTMRADVDPLDTGVYASSSVLGLAVSHSIHGETGYTAFLVQGGLTLGDRDAYLKTEVEAVERRQRYRRGIARLLTLAGFDRVERRAESVLALETALARTHATLAASSVDRNADHRWSRADFARHAPGLDWHAFFESAGLGSQPIVVAWQPGAVTGVAALVASTPIEVWKDYLRVRLIDAHADALPQAFADTSADLRGDRRSREQRALAVTESALSGIIGQLYAERYFAPAQKARVRGIVANVAAAFRQRVANVAWLSPASRAIALAKLDGLYVGIGYPEAWGSWTDLRIDPADAVGNLQRLADRDRRLALSRLATPFDRQQWTLAPQNAGGLLNFQQNAYLFAAALLQPPKYDAAASDAAAYGAIGAIIGHDISHFVDVLGADYQPDGAMTRWWTADDATRFEAAAEPLVRQVAAYEPLPGVHLDGRLSRTENVADLAGLAAAFDAYRASLGTGAADRDAVRRQDREFFIAFAQAFASTMDAPGLRAQIANDHAPETYRINTVRNIDAWYAAFDVVPGQRLYLEPGARVRIW